LSSILLGFDTGILILVELARESAVRGLKSCHIYLL